jgi:hypothetical protein
MGQAISVFNINLSNLAGNLYDRRRQLRKMSVGRELLIHGLMGWDPERIMTKT